MASKKKYTYENWLKGDIETKKELYIDEEWLKIQSKQKFLYEEVVEDKFKEYWKVFKSKLNESNNPERLIEDQLLHLQRLFDVDQELFQVEWQYYSNVLTVPEEFITNSIDIAFRRIEGDTNYLKEILTPDIQKCVVKSQYLRLNIEHDALYRMNKELESICDKEKIKRKEYLNHPQQMLVLYYLQKNDFFKIKSLNPDNTKRAHIIHALLNREHSESRKHIGKMLKVDYLKNNVLKLNLEVILPYFEKAELTYIAEQIKKDLKELS